MQAAQRTSHNHALQYAVRQANQLKSPLLVLFCLFDYPKAQSSHYAFMLEGLAETALQLKEREIPFLMIYTKDSIPHAVTACAKNAKLLVMDDGYTRSQREWRKQTARQVTCKVVQVDTNIIIPIEEVSSKQEYSARTIRPKIHKLLHNYLIPLEEIPLEKSISFNNSPFSFIWVDVLKSAESISSFAVLNPFVPAENLLKLFSSPPAVKLAFKGGPLQGENHLNNFIESKLDLYPKYKNDPNRDVLSHLSPYLHFGQISPLQAALQVLDSASEGKEVFLEELIVRRELAFNYTWYNEDYSSFQGLPLWCKKTLDEHRNDSREYLYTTEELEKGETHDPCWNAAQLEMIYTGKMHGYMRMYWGKKIIEWSPSPEEAFNRAVYLNDKYELDGRDPNGYTGIAWCFGLHDRPWKERKIFGKIRYMNLKGLKRKFDADGYVKKVRQLPQVMNNLPQ